MTAFSECALILLAHNSGTCWRGEGRQMGRDRVNQDRRDQAFDKAAKEPEVIDVGAVSEDQRLIVEDGSVLSTFLQNVAAFMETAQGLEKKAQGLEAESLALVMPTSAEEDEGLQRFVQRARGVSKEIASHWIVTGVFHAMHKRTVALRERGAKKADAAGERAQRLHNGYADRERQKAAEENARRQREEEERAARQRDEEAAKAEAEAVAKEEALEDLSDRERQFVQLFAFGQNTGERAAKAAGFKDPRASASRLLGKAKILTAIKAAQDAAALRKQAEARKAAPLAVREVEQVQPALGGAGSDRTTWKGVVVDEAAFVQAVVDGKLGIPLRCLTVNQAVLTEYARNARPAMARWPGVKAVSSTTTV